LDTFLDLIFIRVVIPTLRAIAAAFACPANQPCRNGRSRLSADQTPLMHSFHIHGKIRPVMYEDSGPATNTPSRGDLIHTPRNDSSAVAAFCGTAQSPAAAFRSVSIGPADVVDRNAPAPYLLKAPEEHLDAPFVAA